MAVNPAFGATYPGSGGGGGTIELDPDLFDIGELDPGPNHLIGTLGDGSWAGIPLTEAWRALLASGDLGAIASTLKYVRSDDFDESIDGAKTFLQPVDMDGNKIVDVANGTDPQDAVNRSQLDGKQAASAILAALAGVTGAANQFPYFTGASAMSMTSLTSFGRSVLGSGSADALNRLLPQTVATAKTAAHDLVVADAGTIVPVNVATGVAVRVPTNAAQAYPVGHTTLIIPIGAGQITYSAVTPGTTTLLTEDSKNKSAAQNTIQALTKIATDTWLLHGAVVA